MRRLLLVLALCSGSFPAAAVEPAWPGGANPDPAVLFCEDYEAPGFEGRFVEYNRRGGALERVAGEGVGGSHAMRAR
jgi:hypothetical protein